MAFDHGQRRIAPMNLVLIFTNVVIWWSYVPVWLIAIVAILALIATGDHYVGMFAVLFLAFILLIAGSLVRLASG